MPITKYIWDEVNDTVLMEKDETGQTTVVYTHEPVPFGGLISERRGNQSRYYHYDALGSTRQLTDATGQVTDTFTYDAFGGLVQRTGTTPVPYRFVGRQGYYFDEQLDQYYVRARHYSSVVARWLSQDPIGYKAADPNLYRYVAGRPTRETDSLGLLIDLDVPPSGSPSPSLCAKVAFLMDLYSHSPGDRMLWLHWLGGTGDPMTISFDYFDQSGRRFRTKRAAQEKARTMGSSAKCGETVFGTYSEDDPIAISYYVPMINEYHYTATCSFLVTKNCDAGGCCKSLTLFIKCSYDAKDFVEFKTGPSDGFAVPPYWVHDRLVKACLPAGRDFSLSAHLSDQPYDIRIGCK